MKTLKPFDTRKTPALDVQPGMVIPEGVVLTVRDTPTVVFFDTPGGTVYADHGSSVMVLAKVEDSILEAMRAAMASA